MATKFATNFPIPTSSNIFATIWKLTRTMKAAGWIYKASGAGGSTGTKDTTSVAANDIWGVNADPTLDLYSNVSNATTGTGTLSGTFSIAVTSTTGFTASGYVSILTVANGWQTVNYTSLTGGNTFSGCTGGSGTWIAGTPVAQTTVGVTTIGLDQVAAWIVLSGPQTQKIPLSGAPTGTPLRGETITQAGGVEGEYMGHVWDSVSNSGWMAILPRTANNGATPAAPTFANSGTITGSSSGATFSPTGTIITFNREIMIYKDTTQTNGTIYYGCFDASGESAQMFSALAAQSSCVANVGPGQSAVGTNNAFPARAWVCRGTAGSTTATSFVGAATSFQNNAQIAATNCTPSTGVSADGSFYIALSNTNPVNTCFGFAFFRLDDTEPGDCDPFVFLTNSTTAYTTLTNTTTINAGTQVYSSSGLRATVPLFFGYQSRGNGVLDVVNAYTSMPQGDPISSNTVAINTTANQMRIINSPATTRPLVMEPLALYTAGLTAVLNSKPQYKGRCRWLFLTSIGNLYDTYASKTLLNVFTWASTAAATAVGPYDGSTTPVQ